MSSRRRRLAALGAAAVGTVAAAAVAGAVAERKLVGRRRTGEDGDDFGALRSDPVVGRRPTTASRCTPRWTRPTRTSPPVRRVRPSSRRWSSCTATRSTWTAGTSSAPHFRGRRRMVFYDQRSHGRSGRSTKHHATIEQLGRDLPTVLDELVPDGPVVLVGHSMGGMTVMALAEQQPELFGDRVVGVGLVSTTAGGLRTHKVLHAAAARPGHAPDHARAPWRCSRGRPGSWTAPAVPAPTSASWSPASSRSATEVPASYVEFVDEMLAQTPFEVLAEFFPNFDLLDKFSVLHAFEKVPTVIVCGTEDVITSIGHSRRWPRRIRGAQLVEVLERRAHGDPGAHGPGQLRPGADGRRGRRPPAGSQSA